MGPSPDPQGSRASSPPLRPSRTDSSDTVFERLTARAGVSRQSSTVVSQESSSKISLTSEEWEQLVQRMKDSDARRQHWLNRELQKKQEEEAKILQEMGHPKISEASLAIAEKVRRSPSPRSRRTAVDPRPSEEYIKPPSEFSKFHAPSSEPPGEKPDDPYRKSLQRENKSEFLERLMNSQRDRERWIRQQLEEKEKNELEELKKYGKPIISETSRKLAAKLKSLGEVESFAAPIRPRVPDVKPTEETFVPPSSFSKFLQDVSPRKGRRSLSPGGSLAGDLITHTSATNGTPTNGTADTKSKKPLRVKAVSGQESFLRPRIPVAKAQAVSDGLKTEELFMPVSDFNKYAGLNLSPRRGINQSLRRAQSEQVKNAMKPNDAIDPESSHEDVTSASVASKATTPGAPSFLPSARNSPRLSPAMSVMSVKSVDTSHHSSRKDKTLKLSEVELLYVKKEKYDDVVRRLRDYETRCLASEARCRDLDSKLKDSEKQLKELKDPKRNPLSPRSNSPTRGGSTPALTAGHQSPRAMHAMTEELERIRRMFDTVQTQYLSTQKENARLKDMLSVQGKALTMVMNGEDLDSVVQTLGLVDSTDGSVSASPPPTPSEGDAQAENPFLSEDELSPNNPTPISSQPQPQPQSHAVPVTLPALRQVQDLITNLTQCMALAAQQTDALAQAKAREDQLKVTLQNINGSSSNGPSTINAASSNGPTSTVGETPAKKTPPPVKFPQSYRVQKSDKKGASWKPFILTVDSEGYRLSTKDKSEKVKERLPKSTLTEVLPYAFKLECTGQVPWVLRLESDDTAEAATFEQALRQVIQP